MLGTRKRCPVSCFLFNHILELLVSAKRQEKKNHVKKIKMNEVKLNLFEDVIVDFVEHKHKIIIRTNKKI